MSTIKVSKYVSLFQYKTKEYLPRLNNCSKVQNKLGREVKSVLQCISRYNFRRSNRLYQKGWQREQRPKSYSPKIIIFKKNTNGMKNHK